MWRNTIKILSKSECRWDNNKKFIIGSYYNHITYCTVAENKNGYFYLLCYSKFIVLSIAKKNTGSRFVHCKGHIREN